MVGREVWRVEVGRRREVSRSTYLPRYVGREEGGK